MRPRECVTFLLALVSALLIPAFAGEMYRSNSIGQLLDPVQALQPEGWFVMVEEADRLLYHDGELVSTTSVGEGQVQTVDNEGNTIVRRYENSRIVSENTVLPGISRNILYTYDDDGKLCGYTVSENGVVVLIVGYFRATDGSIAAIRSIDLTGDSLWEYLEQNKYVRSDGNMSVKMTRLSGNVIVKDSYIGEQPLLNNVEIGHDADTNDLTVTISEENGTKRETTYSANGNILREILYHQDSPIRTMDYTYDAAGGISTIICSDAILGKTIYQTFSDGVLESERVEEGNAIVKLTTYHHDGTRTETLYDADIPYADVRYAQDGKRVLSVSYR